MRIKHFSLFIYLLVLVGLTACQNKIESPSSSTNEEIIGDFEYKRVNLVISDIDQSMKLYGDILGLTIGDTSTLRKGAFSYSVLNVPPEGTLRFFPLDSREEKRILGLMEVTEIDYDAWQGIKPLDLIFRGTDLANVKNRIQALGLTCLDIKENPMDNGTFYELSCNDFDGHAVFLYEIIKE